MICGEQVPDGMSHTCKAAGTLATASTYFSWTDPLDRIATALEHIVDDLGEATGLLNCIAVALETISAVYEGPSDAEDELLAVCIAVYDHMVNGGGEMDLVDRLHAAIMGARGKE